MDPEQTTRLLADVSGISEAVGKHGQILARLDERSINQEKRIDRVQKVSSGLGAAAGTAMAAFVAGMTKLFGGPSA